MSCLNADPGRRLPPSTRKVSPESVYCSKGDTSSTTADTRDDDARHKERVTKERKKKFTGEDRRYFEETEFLDVDSKLKFKSSGNESDEFIIMREFNVMKAQMTSG
jgi:hypothetical protein